MNIQEAKQIKIADYLQSLGHRPVKQQGANLWYKSPLRNESEASFKVNTMMNSWFDFGIGKGGNIITLASYLYASDSLQFCLNDAIALLQCNHVKAEKHLVRKIVQDCWKLQPSENALTYISYEYNYNSCGHYSPTKRVGRFYTVTRDKLNSI